MRKTRLIILPTRCLNHMGYLLLFLSCPVIGDWGRIRPDSEMSHRSIMLEREGTCAFQKEDPGINEISANSFPQCGPDELRTMEHAIDIAEQKEDHIKHEDTRVARYDGNQRRISNRNLERVRENEERRNIRTRNHRDQRERRLLTTQESRQKDQKMSKREEGGERNVRTLQEVRQDFRTRRVQQSAREMHESRTSIRERSEELDSIRRNNIFIRSENTNRIQVNMRKEMEIRSEKDKGRRVTRSVSNDRRNKEERSILNRRLSLNERRESERREQRERSISRNNRLEHKEIQSRRDHDRVDQQRTSSNRRTLERGDDVNFRRLRRSPSVERREDVNRQTTREANERDYRTSSMRLLISERSDSRGRRSLRRTTSPNTNTRNRLVADDEERKNIRSFTQRLSRSESNERRNMKTYKMTRLSSTERQNNERRYTVLLNRQENQGRRNTIRLATSEERNSRNNFEVRMADLRTNNVRENRVHPETRLNSVITRSSSVIRTPNANDRSSGIRLLRLTRSVSPERTNERTSRRMDRIESRIDSRSDTTRLLLSRRYDTREERKSEGRRSLSVRLLSNERRGYDDSNRRSRRVDNARETNDERMLNGERRNTQRNQRNMDEVSMSLINGEEQRSNRLITRSYTRRTDIRILNQARRIHSGSSDRADMIVRKVRTTQHEQSRREEDTDTLRNIRQNSRLSRSEERNRVTNDRRERRINYETEVSRQGRRETERLSRRVRMLVERNMNNMRKATDNERQDTTVNSRGVRILNTRHEERRISYAIKEEGRRSSDRRVNSIRRQQERKTENLSINEDRENSRQIRFREMKLTRDEVQVIRQKREAIYISQLENRRVNDQDRRLSMRQVKEIRELNTETRRRTNRDSRLTERRISVDSVRKIKQVAAGKTIRLVDERDIGNTRRRKSFEAETFTRWITPVNTAKDRRFREDTRRQTRAERTLEQRRLSRDDASRTSSTQAEGPKKETMFELNNGSDFQAVSMINIKTVNVYREWLTAAVIGLILLMTTRNTKGLPNNMLQPVRYLMENLSFA